MKDGLIEVSWYGPHFGEEPPISGTKGSGTIFFGHCNLHCAYCQNWQISQAKITNQKITSEQLEKIFFDLEKQGCHNINLVTPTIWTVHLIEVIKSAKEKGLKIPIIWNSNAYEKVEILKKLEGLVDIYLPDFKYFDNQLSQKYSQAKDYSQIAKEAIREMYRQVGDLAVRGQGIGVRGLIIRHLVLPNHLENTRKCLEFIRSISDNIHLSLMTQYNPVYQAVDYSEINRTLNLEEYRTVKGWVEELKFKKGWIQEFGESVECFTPDFTKEKPF